MKHLFIINPKAGKGKAISYEKQIHEYFEDKEDKYEVIMTERVGHAVQIVKDYDYSETCKVYAVGGDGTINEVLNGLVGKDAILGIIPAGSGNDFVRTYLKKDDLDNILEKTIEGTPSDIDIGYINGRYFINISSIGFDANVAWNSKHFKHMAFVSGPMSYILGAIEALLKFKSHNITFIVDGKEHNETMFLLAAANGQCYGGGRRIAPKAELKDGLLDIYGIKKSNPLKIIRYFKSILTSKDIKNINDTYYYRCKTLKIISEKDIIVNIDGEFTKTNEFNFNIVPKGIKLVIPNQK